MQRITRGATLALILTLATASAARADVPTGGTSAASTSASTTTTAPPASDSGTSTTGTAVVSPTRTVTLTRSQTKRVQRKVRVRADGKVGLQTRRAIRKYQKRRDLKSTGRPNLETLKAMRLSFASTIERKLSRSTTPEAKEASGTTAPASSQALQTAIDTARAQIGVPYQSAGTTPSGFDCSGLMVYAFGAAGIDLPRTSFDQYEVGTAVERSAIQPGDLVFFDTAGSGASHVGVATSATTVISATTKGVMEHQLDDDYWGSHYVGARRLS
ncbi:C40 family peptidase [Patulibacter sp. S7RM1-6]